MTGGARRGTARLVLVLLALALVAGAGLPAAGADVSAAVAAGDHAHAAQLDGEVVVSDPDPSAGLIAATRFAGSQRFATAALIALETWEQSDRAVLARHDEWPDALAGGYLAGVLGAPVLLVRPDGLQADTVGALEELGVSEVTILGGTQAVGEAVVDALADQDYDVHRVAGPTRYETAAAIAHEGGIAGEVGGRRTAFVATGINFADALTAGPLAYAGNFPILLTPSQSLHPATEQALQDLDIERVLLLGGSSAVSTAVEAAIGDAIGGDDDAVVRLSGATRIETAAAVAQFALDELGFAPLRHGWARGNDFADALTIGPRLGEIGGPLLLVPTPNLADSQAGTNAALAAAVACQTASIDIPGGVAAVSRDVETALRGLLACDDQPLRVEVEADVDAAAARDWVDLRVRVTTNTAAAYGDASVTLDVTGATPAGATVELREDAADPPQPGPLTVRTDAGGEAGAQVSSDVPAVVDVEAVHERADGLTLRDVTQVAFTPPTGAFTYDDVALSSAQEVGEGTAAGLDPPLTGAASVYLDAGSGLVCWQLALDDPGDVDTGSFIGWADGAGIPGSHIHAGVAGTNGPIQVLLGTIDDTTLTAQGCGLTDFDLQAILDAPEAFYVNVHTTRYPAGIARGQLP